MNSGARSPAAFGCRPRSISICPPVSAQGFADACTVRLVEQTTASWEFWYGLLELYGELHGNTAVPAPHIESGFALGPLDSQSAS